MYCVGGSLTQATLDALKHRGLAARRVASPELAALFGAADTPTPRHPVPPRRRSVRRWRPIPAITAAVAGGCTLALAGHALYTSTTTGFYHNIPQIN